MELKWFKYQRLATDWGVYTRLDEWPVFVASRCRDGLTSVCLAGGQGRVVFRMLVPYPAPKRREILDIWS